LVSKNNSIEKIGVNKQGIKIGSTTDTLAYILLGIGGILPGFSVVHESKILAFVGIPLIFIGVLFFYIRSEKYIKNSILVASLMNLNENMRNLNAVFNYRGDALYISPRSLEGITNVTVYISEAHDGTIPSGDELNFDLTKYVDPAVITLTPPGLDLTKMIEKELGDKFSITDINNIVSNLSDIIVEKLELTSYFEIRIMYSNVVTTVKDSIYNDLIYSQNDDSGAIVGDPLTSAIACILSLSTHKAIKIASIEKNDSTIETTYIIL